MDQESQKYHLLGMDCKSCQLLVQMELEDAGFETVRVQGNLNTGFWLEVPTPHIAKLERIGDVIQDASHDGKEYRLGSLIKDL